MKKIIIIFVFIVNPLFAQYTLIPDSIFEQALIDLGIDSDGIINGQVLTSDIDTIITLNLNHEGIEDLTGIEDFAAIEILDVSGNQLELLDVSYNVQLKELHCSSDSSGFNMLMTSLNLSNNVNLELLYGENLIFLESLNVKNGNNPILIVTLPCEFEGNPCELTELGCVTVDDEVAATNNEPPYSNWLIDANHTYSEDCSLSIPSQRAMIFSVYPNPINDYLYITSKNSEVLRLEIFDLLGRKVLTETDNFNQLDVSDLNSGILFVILKTENGTITKKLLKE